MAWDSADVNAPQATGMPLLSHCPGKLRAKSGAHWQVKLATEKADSRIFLKFFFKIFLSRVKGAASRAEIAQLGER